MKDLGQGASHPQMFRRCGWLNMTSDGVAPSLCKDGPLRIAGFETWFKCLVLILKQGTWRGKEELAILGCQLGGFDQERQRKDLEIVNR